MEATETGQRVPSRSLQEEAAAAPWAHRLALLSMFVYIAKVANVVPALGHLGLGKVLIGATVVTLMAEGGGWWNNVFSNPLMRPYVWLLVLATVTLPFAIWHANSLRFLGDYYKDAVLAVLIIVTTCTESDLRRVIWAFVINTVILVIVLFKYGDMGVGSVRLGKNEIAMTAVMAFGLALPMETAGIRTLLKWGIIGVLVAGVLYSSSRGSYLGIAAVAAVYLYRRLGRKILLTLIVSMVLAYVGYLLLPSGSRATLDTLAHLRHDYDFTSPKGRIAIWRYGLHIIATHPLFGVGIGNFPMAEGLLHPNGGEWMDAHNAALQITAEMGIPALIAFLVLLARMWRTGLRVATDGNGTLAQAGNAVFLGTGAYIVTGSFLSQGLSAILYVLMAIAVCLYRIDAASHGRVPDVLRT
ncbi:MAG: O-antigen ligase family protein [Acidiferrobacteraceae bacterium]